MVRFARVFWAAPFIGVGCATPSMLIEMQPPAATVSVDLLDLGPVDVGEVAEGVVRIGNDGDAVLGVQNITLDDGSDGYTVDVDCQTWADGDGVACQIPPGEQATVTVRFSVPEQGRFPGTLRFETATQNSGLAEAGEQGVYADPRRPWYHVGLDAQVYGGAVPLEVTPSEPDVGVVYIGQAESVVLRARNGGQADTEFQGFKAQFQDCDSGFTVEALSPVPQVLAPGDSAFARVTYRPRSRDAAGCEVYAQSRGLRPDSAIDATTVTVLAAEATFPFSRPQIEILEPTAGYQHRGTGPIAVRLRFSGFDDDLNDLYCKIRAARADGMPAIDDCRPEEGNTDGLFTVMLDSQFGIANQAEVLWVTVTDSSGVTVRASVPILNGVDAAADDLDGDGFGSLDPVPDCDDGNPGVHPLAIEIDDGLDNDCDGVVGEGVDRDGDGLIWRTGDCDENDPSTYRGAPEIRDGRDNDCDGRVDEHTTASDDDGDGFTELERDCDDSDPLVGPGAVEWCGDGIDNDCDQIPDEADPQGCETPGSSPIIIGTIRSDATAIEEGSTERLRALVADADDDVTSVAWRVELLDVPFVAADGGAIDLAPVVSLAGGGGTVGVTVVAEDATGRSDQRSETFEVVPAGTFDAPIIVEVEAVSSGCSTLPHPAIGWFAVGGLLVWARRRRH